MNTKGKIIRYDSDLKIEAYRFDSLGQNFPNHFHAYYVIGLIEVGQRNLTVNHQQYSIGPNDMMSFNPMVNHACEQADDGSLNYRCINIDPVIMAGIAREVLGSSQLPQFRQPVQYQTILAPVFRKLHDCIMNGMSGLEKEELFLLFMQQILTAYASQTEQAASRPVRSEIEAVCTYLEKHYKERITLDMLVPVAGLNKYTLIRTFTRWKGITPYRYLETIRIGKARQLLEKGIEPSETALLTGFSDQSHLTAYFNKLIGLTPGQYQAIFNGDD